MGMKKTDPASFSLSAVLDLNEAALLHARLASLRGSDLSIDASGVERAGTQCIQVLVAAATAWQADGKAFLVEKASDAFSKTVQLIGLDSENLVAKESGI